jgi:hypothetical protein
MNICRNCANNQICGKKNLGECEHYDVSFTRSEIFSMLKKADDKTRTLMLNAVEKVYKIKLAY